MWLVTGRNDERLIFNLQVPRLDKFEVCKLPDNISVQNLGLGCHLTLIKRKEFIRRDDKTLISMAESRGLFGGKQQKVADSNL